MDLAPDQAFRALADPTRRKLFERLSCEGAMTVHGLTTGSGVSQPAVSKHLAVLEEAGLVTRRKQGREVLYQVEAGRLDQATQAMANLAARWDQRLNAIKRLAEAAHAEAKKSGGS